MSGILPDAGFIYQRKVFIYYFLVYLSKHDLAECKLELNFKRASKLKDSYNYSIDFSILTNAGTLHYFEVKDREDLHKVEELKPVFINFYDRYTHDNNANFFLVHSWDQRKKLADLYLETTKEETLKSLINSIHYDQEFTSLMFPYQLHNQVDQNLNLSEIDLRSIALIDLILNCMNVKRYGYANTIYNTICLFIDNQVVSKADEIKRILDTKHPTVPDREFIKLKIGELLLFKDCFVDKLSNARHKKEEIFDNFCTYFNIPSKITAGKTIIQQT